MAILYALTRKQLEGLSETPRSDRKDAVIDFRGILLISSDRDTPPKALNDFYRQNLAHALFRGKAIPAEVLRAEESLILELCEKDNLPLPSGMGSHDAPEKITVEIEAEEQPETELVSLSLSLF
jgi:hypothetical protein